MMKLDKIVSKDELRPAMTYIYVTKEDCVATNGHVVGIVKTINIATNTAEFIECIPDEGFYVHPDDWKKLKDINILILIGGIIHAIPQKGRKILIETIKIDDVFKYPRYKDVIPSGTPVETETIGFNYGLLSDLCEAIGVDSKEKTIYPVFYGQKKPIKIKLDNGNYGIIMPVMPKKDLIEN
jgi:hypothetical protein